MDADFGQYKTGPNRLTRQQTKRRLLRRLLLAGIATVMVGGSVGCTSIYNGAQSAFKKSECIDDFMVAHRNRVMAAKAWYRVKDCYCDTAHLCEFKDGFIQGYLDVAEGSDGCTPAIVPSSYWGWKYQSPDGQAAVNAWFAGFPLGVKAAEQDGVANWREIRPMGMNVPANANSYPTQPYGAPPMVIHDENGVPMLNQPGAVVVQPEDNVPTEFDEDSDAPLSPSDASEPDPLTLEDILDPAAPVPAAPDTDTEAANPAPFGPLGSTPNSSSSDLSDASDLVPTDSTTTYSLNDDVETVADGENMIEDIFGSIELPAEESTIDGSVEQSANTQPADATEDSAVKTADASDDLPFKFE